MQHIWHDNDWFISLMSAAALAAAVIGNYYYHGGHLVW